MSLEPQNEMNPVWNGRVFSADIDTFRRDFGRRAFALRHNLAGHALFTPERLAQAAERAIAKGRQDRFVAAGSGATGARFHDMAERPKIAGAIADLRNADAWMKLSTINGYDDDYADLLSDALKDIQELSADADVAHVTHAQLTVFMASPNIITPYHIDHESNFLSQIAGEKKTVCVFPPDDRELLPSDEIEKFYTIDINGAQYREELQGRGVEYALKPGTSVHHPPLAPHWVKNGDDLSISLSLNFCMAPLERRARVYQVNHYLREIGFNPPEPRAGFPDDIKAGALAAISKRNPKTYREVVFSGIDRARKPFAMAVAAAAFVAKLFSTGAPTEF